MSESLEIQSHRGPYQVRFETGALEALAAVPLAGKHVLVDSNVASIYRQALGPVLEHPGTILIEASEEAKTLDRFTGYVESLVGQSVRRGESLVAIGGGVLQDITAFLATTLLRGLRWEFYPTTLLAQADSCIGSKSSINVGTTKNILGTYCPPAQIHIDVQVLRTLREVDVRSGIGEMLKVHAISGSEDFDRIGAAYGDLQSDPATLIHFIHRSLAIKKTLIELDEFDAGPRNVMNYGHSFGHAIEAATDFAVPHGIAVTLGMDLANYVACRMGRMEWHHFDRMHPVLAANSHGFRDVHVPREPFFTALGRDKKNTGDLLNLILPDASGKPARVGVPRSDAFREWCEEFFCGVTRRD